MDIQLIEKTDKDIARAIESEICRQKTTLELIASENFTSRAVMAVQGSLLTNKYAEGYPFRRYYGGCENADTVEHLAIERAKRLFHADYANVQPHSGSQANMTVYFALLKPGDTIMGMDLSHGGHLTHGSPASFSGKLFNFVHYGVRKETGRIDHDMVEALAIKHRPKMIVAGASAYPRFIDFEKFSQIAKSIRAYLMVDMAHIAGLVAAGVHPSPIPYSDVVTSTTHKTLRGARGGLILAQKGHGTRLSSELFPGIQGGPLMHIIAAKAVTFQEALGEPFRIYQQNTVENAKVLARYLMQEGVDLISNGTDNHLMLLDLRKLHITGKQAEQALDRAGITVNKNSIPYDTQSPYVTSGIRIGTPAVTTRGMKVGEMQRIGQLIMAVLRDPENETVMGKVRFQVHELCEAFPVYPDLDTGGS